MSNRRRTRNVANSRLLSTMASTAAPEGGTEAQAWLNSAMNGGAAAGAALAGILLTQPGLGAAGPALTQAAMAVAAAAAAATTAAGHNTVSGVAPERQQLPPLPAAVNRPRRGPGRSLHHQIPERPLGHHRV